MIPLFAPSGQPRSPRALLVTTGEGDPEPLPSDAPAASFAEDGAGYSVWRRNEGFRLVYRGTADFEVTADRIEARSSAPPELVSLFVTGTALSLALIARGHLVLHSSAVLSERGAIAIVGSSGMGKSTLAALLCAGDFELLADDLLRIELASDAVLVHAGSNELRLRHGARDLATLLPGWSARESIDRRLVLRSPNASLPGLSTLRAIVIPSLAAEHTTLARVKGAQALIELLKHPRVLGWKDPVVLERMTRQLADLARRVPVYTATLRRGPPFDRALADAVSAEFRAV